MGRTAVSTSMSSRIFSVTLPSICSISPGVSGAKCEKSKRSRLGATSEPACLTCGTEGLAESGMEHVSEGVMRGRAFARALVHPGAHFLIDDEAPARHLHSMGYEARHGRTGAENLRDSVRAREHSAVSHLAAAFGIKRRRVEEHFALVAFLELAHLGAVPGEGHDADVRELGLAIAFEARLDAATDGSVDTTVGRRRRLLPRIASPGPLQVHLALEARLVDADTGFRGDIDREIEGHSERVVEFESRARRRGSWFARLPRSRASPRGRRLPGSTWFGSGLPPTVPPARRNPSTERAPGRRPSSPRLPSRRGRPGKAPGLPASFHDASPAA